jgi:predicted GNAT family N-acyltransferase
MQIKVERVVNATDLEAVFSIRKTVFVEEQQVNEDEEYDEYEASSRHFLARVDGQPAGTARWRSTSGGYKLERFAVLKEYRRHGVGSALLQTVLNDLPDDDKTAYLHSQVQAMPLYSQAGFAAVGDLFYECDIPHYKMMLER